MSDPADDRILQEYLHRKSALSMGYKRVYIETPPPELDQAVTARARRALRWLVPGILAALIALTIGLGLNFGVGKWVDVMVSAEQKVNRIKKDREEKEEQERLSAPVSVIIDPSALATSPANRSSGAKLSREAWLAKIEQLKTTGTVAEVEAELQRFHAAYPDAGIGTSAPKTEIKKP